MPINISNDTIEIDGTTYDVYEKVRVKGAPTWDTSFAWTLPTGAQQSAFVDITNVADKVNRVSYSTRSSNYSAYETGRQFWLQVGYRF